MNFKEIVELIKLIDDSNLKEFRLRDKDFSLKIRTDKDTGETIISQVPVRPAEVAGHAPVQPAVPLAAAPAPVTSAAQESDESGEPSSYIEIKSPMVGTFYRSPSPDKPAFIQVGDAVTKGKVVCIIEAMKLFNEIESEVSGKIVKVLVEDASPVEYDQPLFLVEPGE